MKILSWNCQGVGNTPIVRHLREIRGRYFPDIIFLCETKNRRNNLENLVEEMGYFDMHSVEPKGKSGGLVIMWKESVQVKIISSNIRMIDTII